MGFADKWRGGPTKSNSGACYKQIDDARVTCWRTYKFCICCLSGQSFSSSKHFQFFLQVYLIPQGWTVLIVQCVIHRIYLCTCTPPKAENSNLLQLPFRHPVKKIKSSQNSKSYVHADLTAAC